MSKEDVRKDPQKLIALETRRYSAMFRRILMEYGERATIRIDGRTFSGESGVSELVENWCTNARIKQTRKFVLEREGRALFGFDEHPRETWAVLTELAFAEALRKEGVARYRVLPVAASWSDWARELLVRLWRRVRH
jgi:hypothetical protein